MACGHVFINKIGRYRRLGERLATLASALAPYMAFYRKGAKFIVELLADVIADLLHLTATPARCGIQIMVDFAARQCCQQ